MAGITLSADEIKTAPPEVRHWPAPPLVGCNVAETRDILSLVQGMLPVVSVFHCLVAEATMLSILRLWQDIVVRRGLQREPVGTPQQPSEVAGA